MKHKCFNTIYIQSFIISHLKILKVCKNKIGSVLSQKATRLVVGWCLLNLIEKIKEEMADI